MIRIIAGEFKGRRLKTPATAKVRPTADRVREAWFSIVQRSIRGARVLDLYAGSGALGLEALSRGAAAAEFVEAHRFALAALKANIGTLRVGDRAVVHRGDALKFAEQVLFTLDERVALIREAVRHPAVEVQSFDGLLVGFAREVGATLIVRGLRAVSDFEYEFQMALMNRTLAPALETVFLVPAFDLTYLSSSLVREVARFGGDVSQLVHPAVQQALRRKFGR